MKIRQLAFILILLLVAPFVLSANLVAQKASAQTTTLPLYFGIDVAYADVATTEQTIDKISAYTNFFIIGCTGSYNNTRLAIISDYVFAKNLSFLVYTDDPRYPSQAWYTMARSTYGSYFLGIYAIDEPGGQQLDSHNDYLNVWSASSYADAESQFVNNISPWLTTFQDRSGLPVFTSDYAMYWFDYKAGFNTVFAEFGTNYTDWNATRDINIALCRGAATLQNKDWGIMITTTTNRNPPYIESGSALYADMLYAYQNGAKYIIVFDSNPTWTADILGPDQLDAMQQFWQYAQNNPRTPTSPSSRVAYVLPQDFGFGFRGPEDTIWGIWPASSDPVAYDLSISMKIMLTNYGNDLDIVYQDGLQASTSSAYGSLIYWNDPGPVAQQWGLYPPSIVTPTPGPTPTPSPTPSPSPIPTIKPSPSPSPSPTPSTSTQQPSSTPDRQSNSFLTDGVYIVLAVALVAVVSLVAFIVGRRRR